MNEHVEDLISAYIDNELSDPDRELVNQHIRVCSKCRELLEDLSSVQQMVYSHYQGLEGAANLEDLIMQRIHGDNGAMEKSGYWLGTVISILSLAAVIAVFLPFLYFGGIISTMIHITFRLISLLPIFIGSMPILMVGIIFSGSVLIFLSIWSLRNLLGGGWIEKHIT